MYVVDLEGKKDLERAKALHDRFGIATTIFTPGGKGWLNLPRTIHVWPSYHIIEQ